MQISKGQRRDKFPALFKKFFRLARKSDHHVGSDRRFRRSRANLLQALRIMPWPVFAMHGPQNLVTARLQRQVRMPRNAWMRGYKLDQFVAPIHRLHRADAQLLQLGLLYDGPHQIGKALLRLQVPAPAPQIDARDHHLAIARLDQLAHLAQYFFPGQRPAAPAHRRNHAERAAVVAAILHFEVGPRALRAGGKHRRGEQLGMREDVANEDVRT